MIFTEVQWLIIATFIFGLITGAVITAIVILCDTDKEERMSTLKPKLEFGAPVTGVNYKVIDRESKIVHWFCYEDKESMKDLLRSCRYGACDIDLQVINMDENGGIEHIG